MLMRRMPPSRDLIGTRFPGNGVVEMSMTPTSRILDVGCGAGELLLTLQACGFSALTGVDPYLESDITYPGGLRILKQSIRELAGEWDVVMFHHSFEHVADPAGTLEAATRLLAPEGTLLIRLRVVSSAAWERYGVEWVQLDAPRHFFLHSVDSMKRLTSETRLRISKLVYDSGPFQFVGGELYRRNIPLRRTLPTEIEARVAAFSQAELDDLERQARALNAEGRGDQAAFYLKRFV